MKVHDTVTVVCILWRSDAFRSFVDYCLLKLPQDRPSSAELLRVSNRMHTMFTDAGEIIMPHKKSLIEVQAWLLSAHTLLLIHSHSESRSQTQKYLCDTHTWIVTFRLSNVNLCSLISLHSYIHKELKNYAYSVTQIMQFIASKYSTDGFGF